MILEIVLQHRVLKYYQVCSNDDPWLTLTCFMAMSNLVHCAFIWGKVKILSYFAFIWEKGKTIDFSAAIVVYDTKLVDAVKQMST